MSDRNYSGKTRCGHCYIVTPMEIRSVLSQVKDHDNPRTGYRWQAGPVYELLVCPVCDGVLLRRHFWHECFVDDTPTEILYPQQPEVPAGLPASIQQEYESALKVRSTSPNAYGVLLGRLLELVCEDRGARRGGLGARLLELSSRGEIPGKLADVAKKLQELRNVGAHALVGDLTAAEVPILESLCRAILEYVYTAPHLVKQAADRLQRISRSQRGQGGP